MQTFSYIFKTFFASNWFFSPKIQNYKKTFVYLLQFTYNFDLHLPFILIRFEFNILCISNFEMKFTGHIKVYVFIHFVRCKLIVIQFLIKKLRRVHRFILFIDGGIELLIWMSLLHCNIQNKRVLNSARKYSILFLFTSNLCKLLFIRSFLED